MVDRVAQAVPVAVDEAVAVVLAEAADSVGDAEAVEAGLLQVDAIR